jgi:hypothetical protein
MRFTNVKCGVGQGWRITRDALRTNRRPLTAVRSRSSGLRIHAMVVTRLSGRNRSTRKRDLSRLTKPQMGKRDIHRTSRLCNTANASASRQLVKLRSLGAFGSNICRNRFAVCDTEVAGPLKERGLSESHGQRHEQHNSGVRWTVVSFPQRLDETSSSKILDQCVHSSEVQYDPSLGTNRGQERVCSQLTT